MYATRYFPVVSVSNFDIDSNQASWGSLDAVDVEADSVSLRAADLMVSGSICRASTFERNRIVNLHGLYRRAFRLPQNHNHLVTGDVRTGLHLAAGARFRQKTPDRLCSVRPPASCRLKISLPRFADPVRFAGSCSLIFFY
jgi:hypothetical protein